MRARPEHHTIICSTGILCPHANKQSTQPKWAISPHQSKLFNIHPKFNLIPGISSSYFEENFNDSYYIKEQSLWIGEGERDKSRTNFPSPQKNSRWRLQAL